MKKEISSLIKHITEKDDNNANDGFNNANLKMSGDIQKQSNER